MLPGSLQDSERPAEALAHESVGRGRSFGICQRSIFVLDLVAGLQQSHGQVGVFSDGVVVVTAGGANGLGAPSTDGSGDDADARKSVKGAPFEILAGDVFQGLPASPRD